MAAVLQLKQLTKGEYMRMALQTNLRLALRDGKDEVTCGITPQRRQPAVDALYECSPGYRHVEPLFAEAVQAVAAGESFGVIGQRFAAWVQAASDNYVRITAECHEDPMWGKWIEFREPAK